MKVVIMRHGRPIMDLDKLKRQSMNSADLGYLVQAYELSDLAEDSVPTASAIGVVRGCKWILSSDLPRAVATAQKLSLPVEHQQLSDLRESPLPYLNWRGLKLRFFTWAICYRLAWLLGFRRNGEAMSEAKRRSIYCADHIEQKAMEKEQVLVVGHGIINRLIIKELKKRHWSVTESNGEGYWSYRVLESNL